MNTARPINTTSPAAAALRSTCLAIWTLAATLVLAPAWAGAAADSVPPAYQLVHDVDLGAPNVWDYLTVNEDGRVFVTHETRVDVLDGSSGERLGQVEPLVNAHGIATVPAQNKGYASSARDGVVTVFSLDDYRILKTIKVPEDADGVEYDPASGMVLNVAGDSRTLTVIDPKKDDIARTIELPGEPEFLAPDGTGKVFVNIADKNAIARVDIASGKVLALWPLEGCRSPHGLVYDRKAKRLYSSCLNETLVVLDARSGKQEASFPIGKFTDGVKFDPVRRRAICANAFGTMTVVYEGADGKLQAHDVPTFFGGRTLTVNPKTGWVYVSHGNMTIESSLRDLSKLRFGWDGLRVAIFKPLDK